METELSDMTDKIYDTLLGNVGMSPAHESFDTVLLSEQECDARRGEITFWLENGNVYQLKITKISDPYVEERA